MDIKTVANKLAIKHGTRNPIQIATELGFIVLFVPLSNVRGFYRYINRCHVIYISDALDAVQSSLVCAHELGHIFLHKGLNRMFMDRCTYMVTGKYENEAHQFSVDLIYDDEELQPFLCRPISDAADYMGVNTALAQYRMGHVEPSLW